MDEEEHPKPEPKGQNKKSILKWVAGSCVVALIIVGLLYVLSAPPTPAEAAEQYIEDHYDAVAEAVMHAVFSDNPLKAEIIAEVAESIAEQVIPYSCQATTETETAVDAQCNLSLSLNRPIELRIDAPFRVSMSTTSQGPFGRTKPVVQDSSPIISEMTVNGLSLEKFSEAQATAKKVKKTITEVEPEIEEVKEAISEAGSEIKDLFGK